MFRNNITFMGICTMVLFITMGVSQVSLTIGDVDTNAGTLNIKMTTVAGCSSCSDSSFDNKAGCLTYGSSDGGITKDGIWSFDSTMDKTTCESSTTNGDYFNGEIKGFQFQLLGITVTDASGGTAESAGFTTSTSETTYNASTDTQTPSILAFSLTGSTIPVGSDAILTQVTFSNYEGEGICFGVDTGGAGANTISDSNGLYLAADWGDCYCESTSPMDCAGVCGGAGVLNADGDGACCASGVIDCAGVCDGTTTDTDSDGVCDADDSCAGTTSGETVDTDGCSESQLSISQVGTALPTEFSIAQNFPNPFNPVTSITFDVAEMDEVSIVVYDLTGKEVITLVSGTYTPGIYNVEWNAVNNAGDGIVSGMYIYRYISSEKAITRKMLYLK